MGPEIEPKRQPTPQEVKAWEEFMRVQDFVAGIHYKSEIVPAHDAAVESVVTEEEHELIRNAASIALTATALAKV